MRAAALIVIIVVVIGTLLFLKHHFEHLHQELNFLFRHSIRAVGRRAGGAARIRGLAAPISIIAGIVTGAILATAQGIDAHKILRDHCQRRRFTQKGSAYIDRTC